jgi:hypothetical protein
MDHAVGCTSICQNRTFAAKKPAPGRRRRDLGVREIEMFGQANQGPPRRLSRRLRS